MGEPLPAPTPEKPSPVMSLRRRKLLIALVVGFVFVLMITVVLITYLALSNLIPSDSPEPSTPAQVASPTPTQTPSVPASPLATPSSCETVVNSGSIRAPVPLPRLLTVGDQAFPVISIVPGGGSGALTSGSPGSVAWVCGTVVNYVLMLEPVAENETLVATLKPGDEITLKLSDGLELVFQFSEQREVASTDTSVFEQSRPRLTLILPEGVDTQRVAVANHVSEREPVLPPAESLAQPNEPVRVGDAQVIVITGRAESSEAGLDPGTMYYVVEFSIENVGTAPLETGQFDTRLHDSMGNEYLLSPAASAIGDHGPLSGAVAPGNTAQGTAGFVVPESLAGPTLIWSINPRPGSELRASVQIPYEAPEEIIPFVHSEVVITDVFLDDDGDVLVIEGELRNEGSAPLTVEATDISLTSNVGGVGELLMAAPPLPWTIQPDQVQIVELQYRRPDTPVALLSLLGYSFEIEGLP